MRGVRSTAACLFALLSAAALAIGSDRVVLKNGGEVKGAILKSDAESVVVDLGCEVLRLPAGAVLRVEKGDPSTATRPAATQAAEKSGPKWQLYRTAELKESTIEAGAETFGEGVVMVTTPGGAGSGFVINGDGHMITNYHVIAGETRIKVTVFRRTKQGFEQNHYKKVKIVALNPFVDLALLKIEGADGPFKYVYLGSMNDVLVGQSVFAIGNPLGLTRTVSQGIVSTKNRNFQGQLYVQTTADVNPGNSGGPLFNLKGEVIGVTSMGYIFLSGLNFAIPVDVVKRFIENRDAFVYDEDNPNAGFRYLQPDRRVNKDRPRQGKVPTLESVNQADADKTTTQKGSGQ